MDKTPASMHERSPGQPACPVIHPAKNCGATSRCRAARSDNRFRDLGARIEGSLSSLREKCVRTPSFVTMASRVQITAALISRCVAIMPDDSRPSADCSRFMSLMLRSHHPLQHLVFEMPWLRTIIRRSINLDRTNAPVVSEDRVNTEIPICYRVQRLTSIVL